RAIRAYYWCDWLSTMAISNAAISAETGMPIETAAKKVAQKLMGAITRKRPSWKPKRWISIRPITKLGTDRNNEGKPRSKPWPNRLGRNWVPKAIATASSSAMAKAADERASVDG